MFRRLLASMGLLLSLVATAVFISVGVQVWSVRAEVNRQTDHLTKQAYSAAATANGAIKFVDDVITKAKADLRATQGPASAPEAVQLSPILQMTARQASINLAGSVERALGAVVTASDAVMVVNAALEIVTEYTQVEKYFGVSPDQIRQTRTALDSVSGELKQARTVLGVPIGSNDAVPTPEQLAAVDEALRLADNFRAEMQRVVEVARKRVEDTKRLIDVWAWRIAVGTTTLSVFGVVGQFFLARFCIRKLLHLPA